MPPHETDPLLPRGISAPEISGCGFSRPAQTRDQTRAEVVEGLKDGVGEDNEQTSQTAGEYLPPRIIIALFTTVVGLAIIITAFFPRTWDFPWRNPPDHLSNISARVDKLLTVNPLIDGHNDLAILIRYLYRNKIYDKNFTLKFEDGGMYAQVDLPRLQRGKVGGAFWSAFTPCPQNSTDISDDNYDEAVLTTLSQLDLLQRLTLSYPKIFSSPTLNSSGALAAFRKDGHMISPIGVEGLHQIGNSFSNLRLYHSLGVKYSTLTHNCNNAFADAALTTNPAGQTIKGPALWGGLSQKGQLVVQEMNRMGMLVDLAHVSRDTMLDVLGARPSKFGGSKAPIIFSHSSAYSLCPHPRNVQDDILQLIRKTNSVIMVNFSPDFISCIPSSSKTGIPNPYPPNATLHQVARHVEYIGKLIGFDHVGLGSDFDGIPTVPEGLEDVSKFPELVAELLRMGISDVDAAKVVGSNILRVWGDAESVATKMQKEGAHPVQDEIKKLHFLQ